jgi:hypothetical protein
MSAENFIKFFKSKKTSGNFDDASDYADYTRFVATNKTWFNKNRADLEALGLSRNVGVVVSETKAAELGVSEAFKNLQQQFSGNSDVSKPIVDTVDGKTYILFPETPFKDGVERTLDKYLGSGTSAKFKEMGMVKGHIYGMMTGAVLGARDELYSYLTKGDMPIMSEDEADYALGFLDNLILHLQKLDIDSAELKTLTSPVFLKYYKSSTNFLIELQSEVDNAASAKLVQRLSGQKGGSTGIRALVNPQSTQAKALAGILDVLAKDANFSSNEILDFKSSDPMIDMIADEVLGPIGRKRKTPKEVKSPKIKLPNEIVVAYVDEKAKSEYRKKLQKTLKEAESNRAKIKKQKNNIQQVKSAALAKTDLLSLTNLLNSHLQDVISANMGDGTAKNILNYRSGRFASTVKAEYATMSRQGMITVFYSYMKNPYATFSSGGRQSSPKTRDPKLLIAKSIREIAAKAVDSKLRAVAL